MKESGKMKKLGYILLSLVLVLGLVSCTQSTEARWQEQYDLGVRYLSEGNYEEAIIAFTAAIEIDSLAPDAYLKLAETYVALGDLEQAAQILYSGWKNCPADQQTFTDFLKQLGYIVDADGELVSLAVMEKTAFTAYQEILDTLYYGISSHWAGFDAEVLAEQGMNLSYMWYLYPVQSLSDAGYMLRDLNDDGVPELITSIVAAGGGMIYDLYTYLDGEVVNLASSGERNRYYLCTDNVIANEGSSGAADSVFGFYQFNSGASALELKELVRYYGMDNADEPWFYGTTNTDDVAGMEQISEGEARALIDGYTRVPLTLTLLEQYSPAAEVQDRLPASEIPSLFPVDYIGMTVAEVSELLGDDFLYSANWYAGAAKPFYYADHRVPLRFYFLDPEYIGTADGSEEIIFVEYTPAEDDGIEEIAPGIFAFATYDQLSALGYEGNFYSGDIEWLRDMNETGLYQIQYNSSISISFYWFDNDDPHSTPAETVMISSH